jgi:hypothetical protein
MGRRLVSAVLALQVLAAVWMVGSASPAAARTHWDAGTYQLFVFGEGTIPATLILLPNHTLRFPGSPTTGPWSAARRGHQVTIFLDYQGDQAPSEVCALAGLPPVCYFHVSLNGLKTPAGIGSAEQPGEQDISIGGSTFMSNPFFAVRTGPVQRGTA